MAQQNGEDELAKIRAELIELQRSFNLLVRSQASFVAAARQAEEAAQARHRLLMNAIGSLRPLILAESGEEAERRVVVTDADPPSKREVTGRFKVAGVDVEVAGEGKHFKELAWKIGKWLALALGMALSGGIGWLVGFVKQLGEHK